jgi:large conductance mechanosensitive channel
MKVPVSGLWEEFKTFAFKGNMIDLAVAVVIGAAFGKIITAIVADIIMPLVGYALRILHLPPSYAQWHWHQFMVGDLLAQTIDFLIVAAAVFIVIVKLLGAIMKKASGPPAPAGEPVVKECPFCLSTIPIKARKCAHCTADLPMIA